MINIQAGRLPGPIPADLQGLRQPAGQHHSEPGQTSVVPCIAAGGSRGGTNDNTYTNNNNNDNTYTNNNNNDNTYTNNNNNDDGVMWLDDDDNAWQHDDGVLHMMHDDDGVLQMARDNDGIVTMVDAHQDVAVQPPSQQGIREHQSQAQSAIPSRGGGAGPSSLCAGGTSTGQPSTTGITLPSGCAAGMLCFVYTCIVVLYILV